MFASDSFQGVDMGAAEASLTCSPALVTIMNSVFTTLMQALILLIQIHVPIHHTRVLCVGKLTLPASQTKVFGYVCYTHFSELSLTNLIRGLRVLASPTPLIGSKSHCHRRVIKKYMI